MATISTNFYRRLNRNYGEGTAKIFKSYSNNNRKLVNRTSHKKFLIKCRQKGIIPKHIGHSFAGLYSLFRPNSKCLKKLDKLICRWKKDILNLEISEAFSILLDLNTSNRSIADTIMARTPPSEHQNFFKLQRDFFTKRSIELKRIKNKKFDNLIQSHTQESIPNFYANEKFILNYTDVTLPPEVQLILGLGEKFAINDGLKNVPFMKLICDIEHALLSIENIDDRNALRNTLANNVLGFAMKGGHLDFRDKFINSIYSETEKFISQCNKLDNESRIIFARTDKSKQTVVLYERDYFNSLRNLLENKNDYIVCRKDPTSRVIEKNRIYIKKLVDSGKIDLSNKFKLTPKNVNAPRIYGLVKSHKTGVGRGNIILRPVVSYIGSPLYELSKFLGSSISSSMNCDYILKNSYQLCQLIKNQYIPTNYKLVSFDIVSLFTCLPQDFLLKCVEEKWDEIREFTQLSLSEFFEGVELCLSNSYLVSQGTFYCQVSGTPMGAPISSSIAMLAVINVFSKIQALLPFDIPFLYDYVDDSITAIPENLIEETLEIFNSIHPKIQFTCELEVNGKLPYLDLLLIRNPDGSVSTDFYQKPLSSNRILNFNSAHSMSLKFNTAIGLIKRVFNFSTVKNDREKSDIISSILKSNNYPKSFINMAINKYKHLVSTNVSDQNYSNPTPNQPNICLSSIVHVKGLTNNLIQKIKSKNGGKNIATSMHSSTRSLFSKTKDIIPKEKRSHLIYKIDCSNCTANYIGMTSRQTIHTRLKQHQNDQSKSIRTRQTTTALTEHVVECNHKFNFDIKNVNVLGVESCYPKLKTLEMLNIYNDSNSCNKRSDIDNTIIQYQTLMNFLRNKNLI